MNGIVFNYFAIFSVAIVSFILGGAYVAIFKNLYTKLNGLTHAETEKNQKRNPQGLIGIFIANLAMAFGLAYFVSATGISNVSGALSITFWAFIGFVGPLTIAPVLWEGKTIKLWIFNNVINIISLFAMILILTFWK